MGKKNKKSKHMEKTNLLAPDIIMDVQQKPRKGKEVFRSRFVVKFGAVSSKITMYEDGDNSFTDFDTEIDVMKLID